MDKRTAALGWALISVRRPSLALRRGACIRTGESGRAASRDEFQVSLTSCAVLTSRLGGTTARALLPRDIADDSHSEMEVTPDPSDSFRSPLSLDPICRLRRMRPRMIDARMTCRGSQYRRLHAGCRLLTNAPRTTLTTFFTDLIRMAHT